MRHRKPNFLDAWASSAGGTEPATAPVMIAQWDSSLSVLPVSRVQFPAMAEYFKGFSLADRTLRTRPEPAWQKMAQSPLNELPSLWGTRVQAESLLMTHPGKHSA